MGWHEIDICNLPARPNSWAARSRWRDCGTCGHATFYLKYIAPARKAIAQGRQQIGELDQLPGWDSLLGLQFENLVLNNRAAIENRLEIHGRVLRGGPFRQTQTRRQRGCQIDLLLETEHSLYLAEIKFRKTIGTRIIDEVEQKIQRLSLPRRMRHLNRFPVLIHAGELEPALRATDFFHRRIDFAELLEAKVVEGTDQE